MLNFETELKENSEIQYNFTPNDVQTYFQDLLDSLKSSGEWITDIRYKFYLSPSDSFENITSHIDVREKSVATVASSGEFSQIFIGGAAREVTLFDISMAALLQSELRIVAMRKLSFDEYIVMWSTWNRPGRKQLFDTDMYEKIQQYLSPQAKMFFSLLMTNTQPLFHRKLNNFSTTRVNRAGKMNQLFKNGQARELYESAKKRAADIPIRMKLIDIEGSTESLNTVPFDILYLSNIGYDVSNSIEIASKALPNIGQRAFFSVCAEDPEQVQKLTTNLGTLNINERSYHLAIEGEDPNASIGILCSLTRL